MAPCLPALGYVILVVLSTYYTTGVPSRSYPTKQFFFQFINIATPRLGYRVSETNFIPERPSFGNKCYSRKTEILKAIYPMVCFHPNFDDEISGSVLFYVSTVKFYFDINIVKCFPIFKKL